MDVVKVKRKDFGKFLDTKGTNSNSKAVKEATSVVSVIFADILQNPFVSLVQRLR